MAAIPNEPLAPPVPEHIELAWIDPVNGLRANADCAGAVELPFYRGSAPTENSPCVPARDERGGKSWWRRLFD